MRTKKQVPKRWSWEEWYRQWDFPTEFKKGNVAFAYHANEPYIGYLEAESERLDEHNERISFYRKKVFDLEAENERLKALIKELEQC